MPTVLITGANRGIGLSFARLYKAKNWTVWGTTRLLADEEVKELSAVADRVIELNVSSEASIRNMALEVKDAPIDLLINNAGVYFSNRDSFDQVTSEDMHTVFSVNAIGPLLVARALLPNLRQTSQPKVVNISSKMGSIDDNTSGGSYSYRASKAALNMFFKSASVDIRDVTFLQLHPGYVATRMVGHRGAVTADESAAAMVKVIDAAGKSLSGQFLDSGNGSKLKW